MQRFWKIDQRFPGSFTNTLRRGVMSIESHFSLPTPVEEVTLPVLSERGVRLLVKRDDLIHPQISGNKWRKLKYNIGALEADPGRPIMTFGGAYSNHIRAVATVASLLGMESTGVIRGEAGSQLNSVLSYVLEQGMKLHFIDRESYRQRNDPGFIAALMRELGTHHLIPEGGSNSDGVRGCKEILAEVKEHFDTVCCAVGTGTTLAGLITGLPASASVLGVPVIKGGGYLLEDVSRLLQAGGYRDNGRWSLELDYHFGGYARQPHELREFTDNLSRETGIPFEPVYTGKMMFALLDLVGRGRFGRGHTLLAIHTGGVFSPS